uniref:Uncharacterized protein n=1 Tax=Streptomyces sp. NBC_00093 TaxID=2975649 RepID=A0AAU2AG87_9ACTN
MNTTEVVNTDNKEADSWPEVLNRLCRAQGQLAAVSRALDRAVKPGSHCPDTRPAHRHWRRQRRRRRRSCSSPARVRHYVPVLAFKRASGQLSERVATLAEKGGET